MLGLHRGELRADAPASDSPAHPNSSPVCYCRRAVTLAAASQRPTEVTFVLPRRCFRCDRLANTAGPEAPQSCRSRWDEWKWMELFGFCVRLDEDEGMDAREQKRLPQIEMVFVSSTSIYWSLVTHGFLYISWFTGEATMGCAAPIAL